MKNIFIQLKPKAQLKKDPLLKILDIDPDQQNLPDYIQEHFDQEGDFSHQDNIEFIFILIKNNQQPPIKDKLYALLVFFTSKLPQEELLNIIDRVEKSAQSISTRVKFFSLLYKSVVDNEIKKKLLSKSINLITEENKISIFSNFVQNFDHLISCLTFNHNQYVTMYLKLINYLEKHLIYKKLWKHYIAICLSSVNPENAQSAEVDTLIVKLLKSSSVTQETIKLLHQQALTTNKFYPYLQSLILGDFQAFEKLDKKVIETAGINVNELERRVKIEAIPRVLSSNNSNVQIVSYQQVSQILKVEKDQIEGYIIQAIQEGILKAKIDQFSQTIIINSVKFRTLRGQQHAALQKNLTDMATRLTQISSR